MGKLDRISGVFWLVFAVIVCVESYRMGLGILRRPGPGFFFFWAGILLAIMSLVILIRAFLPPKDAKSARLVPGGQNLRKIILVLIAVFFYAFFMESLGFVLATFSLFLFLLGAVEKKGWKFTIIASLAVTVAAHLVFETALRSQLPQGFLEFLRF